MRGHDDHDDQSEDIMTNLSEGIIQYSKMITFFLPIYKCFVTVQCH